jgi:tRNA threonylcarbamoyladenosine biosynthesis protein TsaE
MMMSAKSVESHDMEFLVETEQDMQKLAAKVAMSINTDPANFELVVFLSGNLGTGKTTFARGFIRECGFEGIVKSPTYTLVEPYDFGGDKMCYHFDLYRLTDDKQLVGEELELTGARDYFDASSLCLVEWPEKAEAYLPKPDIRCTFTTHGKGRQVKFFPFSDKGKAVMLQVVSNISL